MAIGGECELGYDDNRFEIVVSERFHCPICFLVLKDPVMCKNQHCYCSSCITKHLENFPFCPACREYLSVDTLQASRIARDYLSELNIRCDFYPRGCREIVQVENLKRHVASCGFSPVQRSNDGCNVLVNTRDKLHHEAEVCDFKRSKCHDCCQLKNDVKEVKEQILARQDQMENEVINEVKEMKDEMKNEMKEMKEEMKNEMKEMKEDMKNEMKEILVQVLARQDRMRNKATNEMKEEVRNQMKNEMKRIKEEMKYQIKRELMKEMKEEVKNEIKEIVTNAVRDALAGIKDVAVDNEDLERLQVEIDTIPNIFEAICESMPGEDDIMVEGEFNLTPNR